MMLLFPDPSTHLHNLRDALSSAHPTFSLEKLASIFGDSDRFTTGLNVASAAQNNVVAAAKAFGSVSSVPRSVLGFKSRPQPFSFSRLEPALGKFVSLSRVGSSAVVSVTPASDDLRSQVFSRVLNGSEMVDFRVAGAPPRAGAGADAYFFLKSPIWQSSEDVVQLRRLGAAEVNLTTHESLINGGEEGGSSAKILDVKVHLPGAVVNVRYGSAGAGAERARLLRHALKLASRRAWAREKERLAGRREGTTWTAREAKQILNKGYADGWRAEFARDVKDFPDLANDIDNVKFVKEEE